MNIIEEDPPFIREKERAIPTSNRCEIAYFLKNNRDTEEDHQEKNS